MEKKKKRFSSVSEMLENISDDVEFNQSVKDQMKKRQVVKSLFVIRNSKGFTQSDIADQIGCSQGKISNLEKGKDGDLRFRDLEAYAKVIGYNIEITFKERGFTLVDEIKYIAFELKKKLQQLAKLAHRDHKIAEGAALFFGEAFFNLVKIMKDSVEELPEMPNGEGPYISIGVQDRVLESDDLTASDVDEAESISVETELQPN